MTEPPAEPTAEVPVFTVYCPRCDRSYASLVSKDDAMKRLDAHVPRAHPEYVTFMEEKEEEDL